MENKGWKTLKNVSTQQNPFYAFKEDDVVTPRGGLGKYFYVDLAASVIVIAEDEDKELYLVGQYRYPTSNHYSWEFVSGSVEDNEELLVAAKRELQEELGFLAEDWKELGMFYPSNGYSSEKLYLFLARKLTKTRTNFDVSEDLQLKKVSFDELEGMVLRGEVNCGQTLAALHRYCLYQNSKL